MKTKNIVLRALTMLFSILMILPMVLSWVTVTITAGNSSTTEGAKLSEMSKDFLDASDSGAMMSLAQALFYITFSLAMVLIVLEVLRFFIKDKKAVEISTKVVTIVILVLGILTLLFSFIWCMANSKSVTIMGVTAGSTYLPWFGGVGTLLFSVLIGIFSLIDLKKKKAGKSAE